ncbi:phage tail sheath subtilisin-like domain-containing protein [Selenomonas ruminantium]|uniref:Phage tail sheath protein n=1 Tax=Selenomonas ruminantium TaxID=971 RepID=A0A1H0N1P9_SELRU|nr:phage tail sheath subtilisin-like domain-containing protein [Selenomonas ruminantium]SDO86563.1 Phage tail sheath protein [Selenomonas ruminantium]
MAGGEWEITDLPKLPGLYMNFKAAALAAVTTGDRGTVVVPYKAHWGKIGGFTELYRETDILNVFGSIEDSNGSTFYKTLRMCCLGGPKKILGYRLASSAAAKATLTLKDAENADKVTLSAKYEGERGNGFRATLAASLTDEGVYTLKLYEDTTLLKTYSFTTWQGLVDTVNADNSYVTAAKAAANTDLSGNTFKPTTSAAFSGGNSGITGVTAADYIAMLNVLEQETFNFLTLDGVTDASIQTSVASWVINMRKNGKKIMAIMGGSAADDTGDEAVANTIARSAGFNHEGIINVGVGVVLDDVSYCSAEVAPYVAGLIAGQKMTESTTYAATSFDDVTRRWRGGRSSEQEKAVTNGVFLFIYDGRIVKVLQGINTLITLRQKQNNAFKKIRSIRTMDAIDSDMQKTAEDNYIGKINNIVEGREALVGACKQYMEVCAQGGIIEKGTYDVYCDPTYHGANATITPEPDQVFLKWEAQITDVVEKIFSDFVCK